MIDRLKSRNLRGDLFGGITTAIVSLPMALAFGVASGAGAEAGLYGAVLVGLFAALFGGTRTLISEPTGPMTVVMTAVITTLVSAYPENGLSMAFLVVIIAGLVQVLFGVFRLGRYITLMPYSVISGFMSGIGILLIVLQIPPAIGFESPGGGVYGVIQALPGMVRSLHPLEALLAGVTLAILFGMPRRWRRLLPPPLFALIIGTGLSLLLPWGEGLRRIGEMSVGLPSPALPLIPFDYLTRVVIDGVVLGMLGAIDTLLTAMIADSLTREQHDSDRELIGQGIGNTISGLFGGLPGAGATMGTVVNIQSGGRTPLAGVLRAVLLMLAVLFAAPMLGHIPMAVLAGIAIKVGFDILDWSFLKRAHLVSRTATFIMYGVMLLTVLVDLIVAVGAGVFIANIITIERLSNLQAQRVKTISLADDQIVLDDEERNLLERAAGRIVLFYLSGPMIFGVAKAIAREHTALQDAEVLILDLHDVPMLSTTVGLALENVIQDALAEHRTVFIAGASGQARERLERLNLSRPGNVVRFFDHRLDALREATAS